MANNLEVSGTNRGHQRDQEEIPRKRGRREAERKKAKKSKEKQIEQCSIAETKKSKYPGK